MAIAVATTHVNGDEKAWLYLEGEEQAPDHSGFRRYRVLGVLRDGVIAEYREDMGKASGFKGAKKLIHIPSLWEHTVAELIALADTLRWEMAIDIKDWLGLENYKPV